MQLTIVENFELLRLDWKNLLNCENVVGVSKGNGCEDYFLTAALTQSWVELRVPQDSLRLRQLWTSGFKGLRLDLGIVGK